MTRVDELITDLKLLISEHYSLERAIEENTSLKAEIENIKAEIRQQQWYLGVDSVNQVIDIIDKHINHKAESKDIGDYPDAIPNQFDNLTGSMNL